MKNFIISAVLLLAVGLGVAVYFYNKPHQNMTKAEAAFSLPAEELFAAYEADETIANEKYLDQIIEVTGTVTNVTENEEGNLTLTLDGGSMMFGVICEMDTFSDQAAQTYEAGQTITLKGICTGMLMDVVLVRCVPVS